MPPKLRNQEEQTQDSRLRISDASLSSDTSSTTTISSDVIERLIAAQQNSLAALITSQKSSMADLIANLLPVHYPSFSKDSSSLVVHSKKLKVPRWSEDQQPSAYLLSFEQVMEDNGEQRHRWVSLLRHYVSGSMLAAFNAADSLDEYDAVKATLLRALGDTTEETARSWWDISKKTDEMWNSLYQCISVMNTRRLENLSDSKQDILTYITLSRFLDFLPPSCYNFVVARHPTNGREAATLATEF